MIANAFLLALREIRNNIMRAALTTLGIIIGVGAVIMMVTLGNGATRSVTADIAAMGRNLLIVIPGQQRQMGPPVQSTPFTVADSDAIAREIPGLDAVAPETTQQEVVVNANQNHTTTVVGTNAAYFTAREWKLLSGRTFSVGELRAGKATCVIGETVRKDLFGAENPVGARMRVNKVTCDVIGLLAPKGQSTLGQDQDDLVIMPLETVQRRFAGNTDVNVIMVSATNASSVLHIKGLIESLMRERRHVVPGQADNFNVQDLQEISRTVQSTTAILTAFLSAVAAVSLLVGGIIGVTLGLLGSAAVASALKLQFMVEPGVIVIAVLFSAAVGVAFGYFPARRAARLDPIEALRHE